MKVRPAAPADAAAIAAIYAPYVTGSIVSFETEPPDAAEIARRMAEAGAAYPWLVAGDGRLVGYAYAAPFRARAAYRFAVETSVYLAPEAQGRGIGAALYAALLMRLEALGYAQAVASISLPNPASVRLHEAQGFRRVGTYHDVGFKHGRWVSVGLWQRGLSSPSHPGEGRDP